MNPAVSLAMVILGKLPLKKFPVYVLAQFLGAFTGSCTVFGLYYGECQPNINELTGLIYPSCTIKKKKTKKEKTNILLTTASFVSKQL